MINIEATIRWKGYNPKDLKHKSNKRVWVNCDTCNKGRWLPLSVHNRKLEYFCKSCAKTGNKNPMFGKHHSEITRKKISVLLNGHKPTKGTTGLKANIKTRIKMSATRQGILYDEWEHFALEQKYCPNFDNQCRESNREKYNRKCFICGLSESENITSTGKHQRLSVHHVDMRKEQGCDGHKWKLVPLCMYHHTMVHTNLWKDRIVYLLNE